MFRLIRDLGIYRGRKSCCGFEDVLSAVFPITATGAC